MNWLRVQTALLDTAGALAAFAANWLLQSTLLIAAGLTIAWLARRRGAALHSAIYRTTLAAVVICPLATLLLSLNGVSGWSLPMPAAWRYVESESPPLETPDAAPVVAAPQTGDTEPGDFANAGDPSWDRRAFTRRPDVAWPAVRAPLPSGEPEPIAASAPPATPASDTASTSSIRAPTVVFEVFAFGFAAIVISLAWIVGATLLVARLALAWRRLHRMLRKASPVDIAVQDACQQAAALVGVAAPKVLSSPYITSPCLVAVFCRERPLWRSVWCGLTSSRQSRNAAEGVPYRPTGEQPQLARRSPAVILLPELTPALPLRDVLIHELAHWRRGDTGWNLLARLAEAFFFFQPLVWLLARRLEASAEDVCDDYVVQFGGDRSQYARGLLEIAELSTTPLGATAVAMVSLRSILARRVTRILDSSRTLSTRAGNLLLALVIAGGLAGATIVGFVGLGSHPPAIAEPTPETTSEPQKSAADEKHLDASTSATNDASDQKPAEVQNEPESSKPAEQKTFRGQVLDPAGRPFAGATVLVRSEAYDSDDPPLKSTVTDATGHFELSFRWPEFDERVGAKPDLLVVAAADGLAPDWKHVAKDQPPADVSLKLSEEKLIEGRIVNAEGRPLAGVDVRVKTILRYDSDTMKLVLDDFANDRQEILRRCKGWWYGRLANLPAQFTTAADGRFRVRGVAANTMIILHARGGGIRDTQFRATPATLDTIRPPRPPAEARYAARASAVLYGRQFDYIAEPGRRLQGTVRDGETRRPIAKAKVTVYQPTTLGGRSLDVLTAGTDANGRYTLDGCAKDERLQLIVEPPNDEAAYLPWYLDLTDKPGLGPIEQEVELVKGIELRGCIVDSQTGRPLVADVKYEPIRFNKYAAGLYERRSNLNSRATSKPDGSFRIAVAPGPGAIAVSFPKTAPHDYTTVRVSYEEVVKLFEGSPSHRELAHSPDLNEGFPDALPTEAGKGWGLLTQTNGARVVLICPEEQQPLDPLEIKLVRGRSLAGRVLDPAGQPLEGVTAFLGNPHFAWQDLDSPGFLVTALAANEKREISFYHATRKLGAFRVVTAADAAPLEVRLEKCVAVVGRVLDEDSAPRAGMHVWFLPARNPFSLPRLFAVTDAAGRFRTDELIPGAPYELRRSSPNGALGHMQLTDDEIVFSVGSAKTHDFGDIVVKGPVQMVSEHKTANRAGMAAANVAQPPSAVEAVNAPTDDLITVSGTVVDPRGKPFAGAKLFAVRWYWEPHTPHPPLAETTSDAQGHFTISYRKSQFNIDVGREDQWKEVSIAATADGFGAAWVTWRDIPRGKHPTLRLVADDVPIAGRVVDLEGNPVPGVNVRVLNILRPRAANLDAWLAAIRGGELPSTASKHLDVDDELPQCDGWPPFATTGADGRFRINGLGRERVVQLSFSSPNIAYQEVRAVTRRSDALPLKISEDARGWGLVAMVYAAEIELVSPPTQAITGIVRDAETRQPLAGVSIESNVFGGGNRSVNTRQLRTVSDADGRYRLVGMPKGAGNRILAVPNDDQPYLMRAFNVPESRGLEPVKLDLELHRGVWITGRVSDARTGEPVVAWLHYLPFWTNEYAQMTPEFGKPRTPDGFSTRYVSRADGSYRLVGLPGRAIVGAESVLGHYRAGVGAESIAGMDERGLFRTYPSPVEPGRKWPHAMKEINPPPGAEQVACDLILDPGEKLTANVFDPDGKPLEGFEVEGSGVSWTGLRSSRDLHAAFDVITLGPDETRTVIIRHKERKLGKVIRVRLADYPSRRLSVAVEPTARIIGRLVDQQGAPLSGAAVVALVRPTGDFSERLPPIATDAQGRFEYHLPSGCRYDLSAEAAGLKLVGRFAADVAVEAGKTNDLGDVVYGGGVERNKQSSTKANSAEKVAGDKMREERNMAIRGKVLLPDGKPAGGAHVAVIGQRTAVGRGGDNDWGHDVLGNADADENGAYALRFEGASQQTHHYATLVARQDGSAVAWKQVNLDAAETELTVELKPETPLRGRLIDVEGQPAAGVRLSIAWIGARAKDRADGGGTGYRPADHVPPAWIAPVWSDKEGRFVVHGLAAEQGVTLQVTGDDRFAQQTITINTGMSEERGKTDATYRPLIKNAKPGEAVVLALAPAKIFEGTVRYADSGKAVPQARVSIWASQQEPYGSMISLTGTADEHGHYHITPWAGIRFGLSAYPPHDTPYLARQTPLSEAISWKGGERLKKVDLTLPRGVLVRGSIVDAKTGAPVAGAAVQYLPESSNNRNAMDDILTGWQCMEVTDNEGRFTLAVLPGPGRLLVNGQQGKYVFQEFGDRELDSGKPGGTRNYAHAVAKLNPQVGDDALEMKLELKPGATVKGRMVDEHGNASGEALVISRLNISPYVLFWRGHTTPTLGGRFELSGLAEGVEYPVYFLDSKRRLGATEIIKAGDSERTVVLKPCGEATWRLIDEKGEPVAGNYGSAEMVVTPGAAKFDRAARERGELLADADFIANIDRANHPLEAGDDDGRRRLTALIPGATYRVMGKRGGEICVVKEFQVQSKETLDLGEIVVERE